MISERVYGFPVSFRKVLVIFNLRPSCVKEILYTDVQWQHYLQTILSSWADVNYKERMSPMLPSYLALTYFWQLNFPWLHRIDPVNDQRTFVSTRQDHGSC